MKQVIRRSLPATHRTHVNAGVPWRKSSSQCFSNANSANAGRGPFFVSPCVQRSDGGTIYGSYVDEPLALITPTAKYYYHANHLYSVAALTNQAGVVVERYRYDTYGQRTVLAADGVTTRAASSYNQQVGFTGRYEDKETKLWYFRARYYSGMLGRFIGRDPLGYVNGMGLYRGYFVPNGLDPSGRTEIKLGKTNTVGVTSYSGISWIIDWKVTISIDPETDYPGLLIQHVALELNMEKCKVSCLPDKEGDEALEKKKKEILGNDHPLYEAWSIDGKGMVATKEGLKPPNDHFGWPIPKELKGTKGTFKINGTFSYYPGTPLPAAMVPDPNSASGDLPQSKNDPMPNVKPAATKAHWIEVTWNFCDEKIVVSGKDSEGGVY